VTKQLLGCAIVKLQIIGHTIQEYGKTKRGVHADLLQVLLGFLVLIFRYFVLNMTS